MNYNILEKIGKFLIQAQPWIITIVIIYVLCMGMSCIISEKVRSMSTPLLIGGVIGLALALGAKPLGESLAGIFAGATTVIRTLI